VQSKKGYLLVDDTVMEIFARKHTLIQVYEIFRMLKGESIADSKSGSLTLSIIS